MRVLKRHEWWRESYRNARDLDHLSPDALSERVFDCMNNMRVRTERGKLGLLPPSNGEKWILWLTEVFEECVLRGYDYPGPINLSGFRSALANAFQPVPSIEAVIGKYNLTSKPYILKFGDPKWLGIALNAGKFRVSPASFYKSAEHNHARRNAELTRILTPNPRDPRLPKFLYSQGVTPPAGKVGGNIVVSARCDYYLFSLSAAYSSRLFGDFGATACLVIHDPVGFLNRVASTVNERLPEWEYQIGPISYYDPVRVDPSLVQVRFSKPFRHAYQNEMRLTWTPPKGKPELAQFEIEIGSLRNCAELVDLESHLNPPVILPPDPADAPIISYGRTHKESDGMLNQLPDVARMQGLILNREADRHEDWFFLIQYTDSAGTWHEFKVPMLDGLYLLNQLRAAEQEQHLGIWNRA